MRLTHTHTHARTHAHTHTHTHTNTRLTARFLLLTLTVHTGHSLTVDGFADEALLGLGQHQSTEGTESVRAQVTSRRNRERRLHRRHYVREYPARLLHNDNHTRPAVGSATS